MSVVSPPVLGKERLLGVTKNAHPIRPPSLIGITCPATLMLPYRNVMVGFGATVTVSVVVPVPLVGETVIHGLLDEAVNVQVELGAVRVSVPLPPAFPNVSVVGVMV